MQVSMSDSDNDRLCIEGMGEKDGAHIDSESADECSSASSSTDWKRAPTWGEAFCYVNTECTINNIMYVNYKRTS